MYFIIIAVLIQLRKNYIYYKPQFDSKGLKSYKNIFQILKLNQNKTVFPYFISIYKSKIN